MQRTGVFRVERHKSMPRPLAKHIEGETRPEEAVGRAEYGGRASMRIAGDPELADSRLAEALAIKRPGRPGLGNVEFFASGPPPFEAPDAWAAERVVAWARRFATWLDDAIGPDAVIRRLELHLDERSPHLHGDFVPLVRDAHGLKRSWEAVAARMVGHPSAKGPAVMRAIQDRYYENVSQPFGLGRGEIGSRRRHEPPDRDRGLRERVQDAEARTNEAIAAAAAAEASLAAVRRQREVDYAKSRRQGRKLREAEARIAGFPKRLRDGEARGEARGVKKGIKLEQEGRAQVARLERDRRNLLLGR